jgi:AcrR family transcriptional regulator
MADYIRARSDDQKAERMQAIMDAADRLFSTRPYHQITMGAIAQELGWSRSNLYKYAPTQEAIFLSLHTQKNRAWLDELGRELAGAPLPHPEFARTWARVTDRHAGFLRYQEILISVFESNVTLECLTGFKRNFAQMFAAFAPVLARQCRLDDDTTFKLYLRLLYQAPGLYNHFHANELTRQALKLAGLKPDDGSFADAYADFVAMCLEAADTKSGAQA